jgi:hypothetical protein
MTEVLVSIVDWLFQLKPNPPKPPRERKRCDYCNVPQQAMAMRHNKGHRIVTCNRRCEFLYIEAVYRPPDELVSLLQYPP